MSDKASLECQLTGDNGLLLWSLRFSDRSAESSPVVMRSLQRCRKLPNPCYLPHRVRFEWNRKKAASNRSKHRVSFDEALTVFADPLAKIFDDEDHSLDERREIIIGDSASGRLLVVCFSSRGDVIRIFSARRASAQERRDYEENIKP